MAKKVVVPEKIKDLQLSEVGRIKISKDFRLHAITKNGKDIYLGRHEIEVGRDDIIELIAYEENITLIDPPEDE